MYKRIKIHSEIIENYKIITGMLTSHTTFVHRTMQFIHTFNQYVSDCYTRAV